MLHKMKLINSSLAKKSREGFIATIAALNLPNPKMIDVAVPANLKCGVDETTALQG